MRQLIATGIAVLTLVAGMTAAAHDGKAANLSGRWDVNVKGPAAHGDMAATMVLAHSEEKVTGTFSAHGNEHRLAGTFKDGTLTVETTDTPADKGLSFTARLKADGSLDGFLSGPMGDMKWSAARARDSR